MVQNTKVLVLVWFTTLFVPLFGWTNSAILAFNWGGSESVEKALLAAKSDGLESDRGFAIGENFWKSLSNAQTYADHNAGDGLYFSTQPLDSARFGPSLIIVEVEISDIRDEKLFKVMTGEEAQVHPDRLPTLVRYRGSWHVVKSLPKNDRIRIWVRNPTRDDVDKIFQNFQLETNKAKVLELITQIGSRYAARFLKYEKAGGIPENQRDNDSTQKFITHLISQLVDRGLNFPSASNLAAIDMNLFSKQLTHTLHILRQIENQKAIYGFNMTKTIYKKLLTQSVEWTPEILKTLRFYHEDYFARYRTLDFRRSCVALF